MKVLVIILTIFCSLGPIYWLPNIPVFALNLLKLFIFYLLILSILIDWGLNSGFKVRIRESKFILIATLLIALSLVINNELEIGYPNLINYLVPLLILTIIPILSYNYHKYFFEGILKSTRVFALICLLIPLGLLNSSLLWINPLYDNNINGLSFNQLFTGFGGSRTGWSVGAAFIFNLCLFKVLNIRGKFQLFLEYISLLIIGLAILIPGGRGGLFSLFISYIVYIGMKIKHAKFPIFSLILLFLSIIIVISMKDYFRLNEILSGDLNSASNGRIEGYNIVIEELINNLFFGLGIEKSNLTYYGLEYPDPHNVFINFIAKFGIIPFLPILFLFISLFYTMFVRSKNKYIKDLILLLTVPVLIFSFTEPNVLFGNFFNTLIYWLILGYCIKFYQIQNYDYTKVN